MIYAKRAFIMMLAFCLLGCANAHGDILLTDGTVLATGNREQRTYPYAGFASDAVNGIEEHYGNELDNGTDIVLTLDRHLQEIAEAELKKTVLDAQQIMSEASTQIGEHNTLPSTEDALLSGSIIAMDLNGDILALANYGVKNNERTSIGNIAVSAASAPGSIFLPVTVLAGLRSGAIDPHHQVSDQGKFRIEGWEHVQLQCWINQNRLWEHEKLNVSSALQEACFYYLFDAVKQMGADSSLIYETAFDLGLGEITGIQLPGESCGTIIKPAQDSPEMYRSAVGQAGIQVTPISVARYIVSILTGGQIVNANIISGNIPNNAPATYTIDPVHMQYVLEGLRGGAGSKDIVDRHLTGWHYRNDVGLMVSTPDFTDLESSSDAWAAGFAPFNKPSIVVVVYIQNVTSSGYALSTLRNILNEVIQPHRYVRF